MDTLSVALFMLVAFCAGYMLHSWMVGSVQKRIPLAVVDDSGEIKQYEYVTVCASSQTSLLMFFVATAKASGEILEHVKSLEDKRI